LYESKLEMISKSTIDFLKILCYFAMMAQYI
jgi:hypothetical protein